MPVGTERTEASFAYHPPVVQRGRQKAAAGPIRYARKAARPSAYQTFGHRAPDDVFVPAILPHPEANRAVPGDTRFVETIAAAAAASCSTGAARVCPIPQAASQLSASGRATSTRPSKRRAPGARSRSAHPGVRRRVLPVAGHRTAHARGGAGQRRRRVHPFALRRLRAGSAAVVFPLRSGRRGWRNPSSAGPAGALSDQVGSS